MEVDKNPTLVKDEKEKVSEINNLKLNEKENIVEGKKEETINTNEKNIETEAENKKKLKEDSNLKESDKNIKIQTDEKTTKIEKKSESIMEVDDEIKESKSDIKDKDESKSVKEDVKITESISKLKQQDTTDTIKSIKKSEDTTTPDKQTETKESEETDEKSDSLMEVDEKEDKIEFVSKNAEKDTHNDSIQSSEISDDVPAAEKPSSSTKKRPKKVFTPSKSDRVRRESKKIERYEPVVPEKKEIEDVEGIGTPFKDIPHIYAAISKTVPVELKSLHHLAYSRQGTVAVIRRNLYKFNGLPFAEDNPAFEKRKALANRFFITELNKMLKLLGLQQGGNKTQKVDRLMSFMIKPEDSHLRKRSRDSEDGGDEAPTKKRQRQSKKSDSKDTKGKRKTKAKSQPHEDETDDLDISDVSDDSDEKVEGDSPSKSEVEKPPTDGEITTYIKQLLEKADLDEVTMKKLCQQVFDHYPQHDLTPRKAFIKSTVKSILS